MNVSEILLKASTDIPVDWKEVSFTSIEAIVNEDFSVQLNQGDDETFTFTARFREKTMTGDYDCELSRSEKDYGNRYYSLHRCMSFVWTSVVYEMFIRPVYEDLDMDVSYFSKFPDRLREEIGYRLMLYQPRLTREQASVGRDKVVIPKDLNNRLLDQSKRLSQVQRALQFCSTDPDVRSEFPS